MSEKALAKRVIKILKPLHGIRVENPCRPGTPDINCAGDNWIELKQQDQWPVHATTPLRLDHDYTPQQRIFAEDRISKGGKCYVLMQIARDYILLDGLVASKIIGDATQSEIKEQSIFCVDAKNLEAELIGFLTK